MPVARKEAPKKPIDLGIGTAEYGSGGKVIQTDQSVLIETDYCETRWTPFRVGKTYRVFADEVPAANE